MSTSDPTAFDDRFQKAIQRFNDENARDPNTEVEDGVAYPRELLYARRLADWVLRLCPDASEELRLASYCQHLCRWMKPRQSYEMSRIGYLRWRNDLKAFHAEKSGQILRQVGYPEQVVQRVQALNLKKGFPSDPASRVLEDALCLVFLQYQFAELAHRTDGEKMVGILRKTWRKMTPAAQRAALQLPYDATAQALLDQALT